MEKDECGRGSLDANREPKAEFQAGAWLWGQGVTKMPVIQFPF